MKIFLKFSELFIKSKRTRKRFMDILMKNIEDAFRRKSFRGELFLRRDRIELICDDYPDFIENISGISKIQIVKEIEFRNLRDLSRKVSMVLGSRIRGRSFGVRVKRKGKHNFSSLEAERVIGAELVKKGGRVNLDSPEYWVRFEIIDEKAYFIEGEKKGIGGLPLGVEGRVLCLVSGGFDSIVASFFVIKRGAAPEFLFFNLGGYTHLRYVTELLEYFFNNYIFGYRPKLFVCDFRPVVEDIKSVIPPSYWGIILKRKMFEVAESVAKELSIKSIVTGESLGQVSSQTLDSLYVIDRVLKEVFCLRPLIGFDKDDIIDISRKIGVFELCAGCKEYCAVVPDKPVTVPNLEKVEDMELLLEKNIINKVSESKMVFYPPYRIEFEDIEIKDIPEGGIRVDIRDEKERRLFPFDADLYIPYDEVLKFEFDRGKVYIFFCNYGLFSQDVVMKLRKKGIKAYVFEGGIARFLKNKG